MTVKIVFFVAIFCTVISFAAGLAHAMSLPHKIGLPADDYLRVQQLYAGWAFLGIAVIVALAASIASIFFIDAKTFAFYSMIVAACCIALGLAVFFAFTFPANRATQNWTMLPANWQALRMRWEYSHVLGAALSAAALIAQLLAVLNLRRE
jgi:hypothetical protein